MKQILNPNFSVKEMKHLLIAFSEINNGALTLFGPSGTAKSHLIEGLTKELGWKYLKVITPSLLLHHLVGKPDFDKGIDNPMGFIPTKKNLNLTDQDRASIAFGELSKRIGRIDKDTKLVLHLDEIFRVVNKNVATLLFGMISDRMVGMGADNDIPDNVVIVMSGNLEKGQNISLGDIASLSRMVFVPFPVLRENVLEHFENQGLLSHAGTSKAISKAIDNFTESISKTSIPESYQAIRKGLKKSVGNLRQIDYYLRLLNILYPLYSVGEVSANFLDIIDIGCLPSQTPEDKALIKSMRDLYKPSGISIEKLESMSWKEVASKRGVKGTLLSRLKFYFSITGMIDSKLDELVEILLLSEKEVLSSYDSLSSAILGYKKGIIPRFLKMKYKDTNLLSFFIKHKQNGNEDFFVNNLLKEVKV